MKLHEWANRWNIPPQALRELLDIAGYEGTPNPSNLVSETGVQKRCQLNAAKEGTLLWRNNVGVAKRDDGTPIRYGLCNVSSQMNKKIKSSDLIGIRPVKIMPDMVGLTIGQFIARECKKPGWKYTGTDREVAQAKFLATILLNGGDAQFIAGEE